MWLGNLGFAQTTTLENFDTFRRKFSTDRAFQLSRVIFPFKSEVHSDDDVEKRFLQRNQWKHEDYSKSPFLTAENSDVENWHKRPVDEKNANTERLTTCGCAKCECGYFMYHTFQRARGKWYLTGEVFVSN